MVPVLLLALLSGLPDPGGGPLEQAPAVCVVAHIAERSEPIDVETVRRIFLLRQRFWPDGATAHPVNLPASSEVRDAFSRAAFGESVRETASYWNELYFHGTRPPPTLASEAAVLLFVARTPGGVGYVSESLIADLPADVQSVLCFR